MWGEIAQSYLETEAPAEIFLLCSVEECSLWVSTEMSSPVSGISRLVSSL